MISKIIIYLAAVIFIADIVSAEPILILSYSIYKNDSVSVDYIKYANGTVKVYQSPSDEYILEITDENRESILMMRIPVVFYIFSEPPRETNYSMGYQRLVWRNGSKYVNFYHYDSIIYSTDLSDYICNNNGICEPEIGESSDICPDDCFCGNGICEIEKWENYKTCKEDCKSGYADDYCDRVKDGICDPDCSAEEDIDCKEEFPVSYLIGIGSILLVLAYWRLKKREEAKVKKLLRKIRR